MWRGSVAECIHQKAKLRFGFLFAKTEKGKHFFLDFTIVNTNRSTSNFIAIKDQVIGIGKHGLRGVVELGDLLWFWRGKGVVHGMKVIITFYLFKQWKVNYPKWCKNLWIAKTHFLSYCETKLTELGLRLCFSAREDQDDIPCFGLASRCPCSQILLTVKFIYGRFVTPIRIALDPNHSFGTNLGSLYPVDPTIDFFATHGSSSVNCKTPNPFLLVKDLKALILCKRIEPSEMHSKPNIWLV